MNIESQRQATSEEIIQITVYADLNCPYCYALNERLEQMGKAQSVNWLPIEHAPDLYEHSFTDVDKQELIREVDDVAVKAPDISLILPPTRPNSRQASKLLATIMRSSPEKAVKFRTAVYRALWQQGDDISTSEVLEKILLAVGLPRLQPISAADNDLLSWHTAWELGQFARNIPSLESSNNFKLLGLPATEQLEKFLSSGKAKVTSFKDASCVSSDRYSIAVISEIQNDWPNPELLKAVSLYHLYTSVDALIAGDAVHYNLDMIVLNNPRKDAISIIKLLKHSLFTQYTPIFLLTDDEKKHIEAYCSGVADIVRSCVNKEILGHRMVRILRTKRTADKLFEIARMDALTGLYNRREFDAALDREWRHGLREKTPLSLLMIDLDNFKEYNDAYGHSMGDEVLRRFARILESCANRPVDLAVRYGGEEFAVILPNVGVEGAKHVAELIQIQIEMHDIEHAASSAYQHITASIGIAEKDPAADVSMDEFIDNADKALYRAKKNGRNRICVYEKC